MDKLTYDPSMTTWLNPRIEYLFNDDIIEYDISDAGFSIIKEFGLLPIEKIQELEMLPKGMDRHIAIGNLQRDDRVLSKALSDKFAEVRRVFIMANRLSVDQVISVKKDAFFTIGECDRTRFGKVKFNPKNRYSSYLRLTSAGNIEIYYNDNAMDFKQIGERAINRHRLYMYQFLQKYIQFMESKDRMIKKWLMEFIGEYKNGLLDEGYYLEFNALSKVINKPYNFNHIIVPLTQIVLKENV